MKIILAGSTGFIGREVLDQCLRHPSITSIIALSRRDFPAHLTREHDPKLKVVIMNDYLSYPDTVLQDMRGAEACIWSLGKAWLPDTATARTVCLEYTLAAATAMASLLDHSGSSPFSKNDNTDPDKEKNVNKFRFIYLSGGAAERDQTKPLWFKQDYRRIRGQVENELLNHATKHADKFSAVIMRPGLVLAKETSLRDLIRGLAPSVAVDKLAGVMVKKAVEEGNGNEVLENKDINSYSLADR